MVTKKNRPRDFLKTDFIYYWLKFTPPLYCRTTRT